MSVDMYEHRFRQELNKVDKFIPQGVRNQHVWDAKFPAWRALFTSLCFWGHSTGYRLFSYDSFFAYCRKAYTVSHPDAQRYKPYFQGDLLPGMQERVGVWYESGMSEVYLYICLVEAIEDKMKQGVVLYDARVDWKLKGDLIVILNGKPIMISAFHGDRSHRGQIEARQERVERVRKINTSESAHWGNAELLRMPKYEIARNDKDAQIVNGESLFSVSAINELLRTICADAHLDDCYQLTNR